VSFDGSIAAFTLAALVVTLAPGPDTFLVIGNALHGGTRRGLATVAGIVSGGAFYAALFAFGLAALLVHSPGVFFAIKLCGAVYLLWLGYGALRSALRPRRPAHETTDPVAPAPARSLRRAYVQGLVTNTFNPKVAVFYLAFLPQFMAPGDPVAAKSALLIGIHYALGLVWLSLVALAVDRFGAWLRRDAVARALDGAIGVMMTAFGAKLALASAR